MKPYQYLFPPSCMHINIRPLDPRNILKALQQNSQVAFFQSEELKDSKSLDSPTSETYLGRSYLRGFVGWKHNNVQRNTPNSEIIFKCVSWNILEVHFTLHEKKRLHKDSSICCIVNPVQSLKTCLEVRIHPRAMVKTTQISLETPDA